MACLASSQIYFLKLKTGTVQSTKNFLGVLVKSLQLPVCCWWPEITRETLPGAFVLPFNSENVSEFYRWLNVQWSKTNLLEVLEATVC